MNRRLFRRTLADGLLILVCFLSACSAPVQPYTGTRDVRQTSRTDSRLWALSDKFDAEVSHSDKIYPDPVLQAYLQGIVDRLYPDFSGTIHIHVFQSPSLNAFALPNGSLYIHTSLLARCDNEAQAATILGHEAAHFVDRHSLRETENAKSTTAFASVLNLAGIPLVGPLISVSSILGYSQNLESEADRIAYERMLQAGYDTRESVKIFEMLAAETRNMGIEEPYFFSTHPRMVERVASLKGMLEKEPPVNGETGAMIFLQKTATVRIASLEEDLSMNRYKSVIMLLEKPSPPPGYPDYFQYYLGEAYRQRGGDGDDRLAYQAYQKAISAAPDFAPTYRALGLYYLKRKEPDQARHFLGIYLQKMPEAPDREFIQSYLDMLKPGEGS